MKKLCVAYISLSVATLVGATSIDIPLRVDPMRVWRPDRQTILQWRFEGERVEDSGLYGNHGLRRGGARLVANGRHGKGMALGGGADGIFSPLLTGVAMEVAKDQYGSASVDFWCRFEKLPRAPQCLLEWAGVKGKASVRLELLPSGRLRLSGNGLPTTESKEPLAAGPWVFLALRRLVILQPNNIYVEDTGVEVLANGFSSIAALTGGTRYRFPTAAAKELFALGNSLAFDAGFEGLIDEVQVSGVHREYYKLIRQPFLDPANRVPIKRSPKHYRDPTSAVLHASFDQPEDLRAVVPPTDPKLLTRLADSAAPPPEDNKEADLADTGEEGLDLQETFAEPKAKIVPLEPTPGVRGAALLTRGGEATIRLDPAADFTDGSIDFWFKPGDWDSFAPALPKDSPHSYRNTKLHLLTLYGEPRDGKGEPKALVSARVGRVQGDSYEYAFQPHQWTQVHLIWGRHVKHYQPRYYFDGDHVYYDARIVLAKKAAAEAWEKYRPAFIRIGNGLETAYDEIRVYPYAFVGPELGNSLAEFKGEPLHEIGAAAVTFGYKLTLGKMSIAAESMLKDRNAIARASFSLAMPSAGKSFEGAIDHFEDGVGETELDVGLLPAGDYQLEGAAFAKDGRKLGRIEATFNRRELPWLGNRIGYPKTPPAPFEPVVLANGKVAAVDREYAVGADGNFGSIMVRGQEILAAPIRFVVKAGGKETAMPAERAVSFGANTPVEANWQATLAGGGVSIGVAAKFEYDGMAKYELDLQPTAGAAKIEALSLQIPLKDEFAQLMHVLPVEGDFRGYERAGYLKSGEGVVWSSKIWWAAKRPLGNFVPMVWLGGPVRGLCWFADNDEGWAPNNNQPAVTISRQDGVVTLGLHFISEPFTLEARRKIVYGLLATPPKPLPKDYRLWNRGNCEVVGHIGGRLTSCDSFAPWEVPSRDGHFDYWPKDYDWDFAKQASDRQRRSKHSKYIGGRALMLYHDKRFVPSSRENSYFGWEWYRNRSTSYPQSRIDCLIWYMNEWFGKHIMDGIYIDDVFPVPDYNWETGSAYLLPDGRTQPGNGNFAYRQYLKRMYAVFAAHGKRPIITTHMSCTQPIFFHAFSTVAFDCEATGRFGSATSTFMDAWSLDRLMTLDIPERTGLVTVCMLKSTYASRERNKEDWAHMIWRTYRSAAAVWLLFDLNGGMPREFASAWKPYLGVDVEVHPFWRNEKLASATPLFDKPITDEKFLPKKRYWKNREFRQSIARQPLRVTIYKKGDRALVVVANFLRCPVKGRVKVDLAALGVPADRRADVSAHDVDEWPEPEGIDLQRAEKPQAGDAAPLAGPGEDDDLTLEEGDPSLAIDYAKGELTLEIKGHNFRAIELRW